MKRSLVALCTLIALPNLAAARNTSVFFNDVRVDGLKNQSFSNVDVKFDENGDIRITAKGYKITSVEPGGNTPSAPSTGAKHFYIATMQPRVGAAQWDVDVFINKVFVKRFRSKDPEPVFEITKWLQKGQNTIHYQAKKADGDRLSTTPNDYFELVVGDGEMRAGQVMLNKITSYRRTAAEVGSFDSEVNIEVTGQ
jgi:hypothetical protein